MCFRTNWLRHLTGKAKPTGIDLTTGFGYEDRDLLDERESYNIGPVVHFDNGHEIAINYRYRRVDDLSQDECGVFVQYTLPIWSATEGGSWGEGKWINPIDTSWWPSKDE